MITLIGHGYIGKEIARQLTQWNRAYNWVTHKSEIPKNTSVIINAAGVTGYPNVDQCEINKVKTIEGNVTFPVNLHHKTDCRIVHITSGCVYTGYKEGGWLETDEPNFSFDNGSFYSGTKALAQQLLEPILEQTQSHLLRIRMPFGVEDDNKNLLTKLSSYTKLISLPNSLSNIEDVGEMAIRFALEHPPAGVYNLCNPGGVTAKEICDIVGIKGKEWVTEEEFSQMVKAPRSNCVLNTDKLTMIFPIDDVRKSLWKVAKHRAMVAMV